MENKQITFQNIRLHDPTDIRQKFSELLLQVIREKKISIFKLDRKLKKFGFRNNAPILKILNRSTLNLPSWEWYFYAFIICGVNIGLIDHSDRNNIDRKI